MMEVKKQNWGKLLERDLTGPPKIGSRTFNKLNTDVKDHLKLQSTQGSRKQDLRTELLKQNARRLSTERTHVSV